VPGVLRGAFLGSGTENTRSEGEEVPWACPRVSEEELFIVAGNDGTKHLFKKPSTEHFLYLRELVSVTGWRLPRHSLIRSPILIHDTRPSRVWVS
jgi:hypothetical protein